MTNRQLLIALEAAEDVLDDLLQRYEGHPPRYGEIQIKRIHAQALEALHSATKHCRCGAARQLCGTASGFANFERGICRVCGLPPL